MKYQLVQLRIEAPASIVRTNKKIVTDKAYKRLTGIAASSNNLCGNKNSVFSQFAIGGEQIYPEGFDAKLIFSGNETNFVERLDRDICIPIQESKVDISYKDRLADGTKYPYTVNIYLRLEN